MLNCQEVTRLLSQAQEQKLGLQERLPLQMHLMMCSGCRNFGKQMDVLRQLARAYVRGADERADKVDKAGGDGD
jgi:hypothetical protein